jgi:nucleoside-diphosphate-sugar epimerase
MRVLILGGTAWLGGVVARYAIEQGHTVTCLARGESGSVPDGARLVTGDRTRPDAYQPLVDTRWDLVVDVSRQPGQVRSALTALSDRSERWVFVSSGSVYADHSRPGAGLETPLLPALDGDEATMETYGEGKVACEEACWSARGDDVLVARSGLIVGYGDRSDRLGYWPGRFALAQEDGGPVLVPQRTDRPAQFLDVVDLAGWIVDAGLHGVTGAVDAYGPRRVLRDVLTAAREVAGFSGEEVPVPDETLRGAGVEEYMGARSLPLWIADPEWAGFNARDTASAQAAGLRARDLTDTLRDVLAWERELGLDRTGRRAGLDRSDELLILMRD